MNDLEEIKSNDKQITFKQRERNLKVYCGYYNWNVLAGGAITSSFRIFIPGRKIKLVSLSVDWQLQDSVTLLMIPIEQATTQRLQISVGNINKIGHNFQVTAGTPITSTGYSFYIFRPCHLQFDSFFCSEELDFLLNLNNFAANNTVHIVSVICEIEDKIIY